jgi:hypothetical protein
MNGGHDEGHGRRFFDYGQFDRDHHDDRRYDGSHRPTPPESGPQPPGAIPPPTPPSRHPTDPPMPSRKPRQGVDPSGPVIRVPKEPKKPKIPDEKKIFIDLSPYFNGIRSQDGTNACTAFAANSIFEYIFNVLRVSNHAKKYLSPLFVWYHTRKKEGKENENSGVSPSNAIYTLHKNGVCFEEFWDFKDLARIWTKTPSRDAEMDAISKKIMEFRELDMYDPDQWVYELLNYNPCYIAIKVPDDWDHFKGSFYTNSTHASGGHAMVIVGYHSHYPYEGRGIKAFKLRNSWDVIWGENGYIWVPADILAKLVFGVWIFKGWKKDDYDLLKKTEGEELLERIKDYAIQEIKWLHKEYKYLHSLKEHIDKEDYQNANKIMSMVRRSENAAEAFEKRIENNLLELIGHMQESPLKPLIDKIKEELITRAKNLDEFEKYIRHGLDYLTKESLKKDKEYHNVKRDVQRIVEQAISILRALEQELDNFLKLEEMIHKNLKH